MSPSAVSATAEPAAERLPKKVGLLKATWTIMRKDLVLEWRGRVRTNATIFFGLLTLLLFSFAIGPDHQMLARVAGGFLWLAIMLASVLSLNESMRVEAENDAVEGLKLIPVDMRALFLGKAVVNLAFLFVLGALMVPVAIAIYDVKLTLGLPNLLFVLFLGCAGITAPGTLYAAIAVQARARDVLLPLLLFPILVPGLLASVKATGLILHGDPMGQIQSWNLLLTGIAAIYWTLCTLMFPRVVEE